MRHQILDRPDFALLDLEFEAAGEKVTAEAGAAVAQSSGITIETGLAGGVFAAAKRKLLGGETLFQNTFTASGPGDRLMLAPAAEGDVERRVLGAGEPFFLQSGAYVAHIGDELSLDTKWGGVKSFFGGLGFFMLKVTGPGTVFYAAYGAIHQIDVTQGYTCDTGHIVGFSPGLNYNIRKFGGFKGLFLSGEGLVCDFQGHGQLYLQTRNPSSLAAFLHPYRPVKSRN
jgi:uncharacterized protein (TIGR00266 family)